MVNKALVSLVALLPVLGSHALAQQHPLAGIHAPQPAALFNEVNFTALFAPASAVDRKSGPVSSWARNSWNGLTTYAGSKPLRCFGEDQEVPYDVAVLGAPFDTTTSYRPGARFGPNGIRQGSRRLSIERINVPMKLRVSDHLDVVDCGDVPMVYIANNVALRQLEIANAAILSRTSLRSTEQVSSEKKSIAKDGKFHPRVLTIGGDHTITLPLLRGVAEVYGPVSVIHFDSHLDTWKPNKSNLPNSPWNPDEEIPVSHGSYFWYAHQEGLMAANQSNIHVGIRNALHSFEDEKDDAEAGFHISYAEDIEEVGYKGIVKRIREVVGDNPVYITLDIDVLDPSFAPATGTPEIGGFTTREIKKILQGLAGLKIVGADIVEVAPGYDTQDEITQIAAANVGWEILALMAHTPLVA